jgi:hypothetical protein
MKKIIWMLLFSLLLIPCQTTAGPVTGCHCFRNRDFDPADRFAADEYLLASSYNSLIASTLNISKRQIVMKKMKGGINADDLLIGLYVTAKTSKPLDLLLTIRDNGGSWQEIMKAPGIITQHSSDPLLEAIGSGQQTEIITKMITEFMLGNYYNCSPGEIEHLQKYHLSNKEAALIFALNKQTGASVNHLIELSQQQKKSWSEIAHQFKLTPAKVGKNILGE